MGRKKRKVAEVEGETSEAAEAIVASPTKTSDEPKEKAEDSDKPSLASKYGLTAHSGIIITEGKKNNVVAIFASQFFQLICFLHRYLRK